MCKMCASDMIHMCYTYILSEFFLFNRRWVVFANASSPFHDLHESILSYQCVCRTENVISWDSSVYDTEDILEEN